MKAEMRETLGSFWSDETGQDLVEYALLVAAVGLALITTVNTLSAAIMSLYSSMIGALTGVEIIQDVR